MKLAELMTADRDVPAAREHVAALMLNARGPDSETNASYNGCPLRSLGIVGAGLMGTAVAAAAIGGGLRVVITDVDSAVVDAAATNVTAELAAAGVTVSEARKSVERLLRPTCEAADVAACNLVLESVAENPRIKKQVYEQIEPLMPEHSILASNTSTIPIRELASDLVRPERFCGAHFFHPVRQRPLLEIIRGPCTDAATVEAVRGFAAAIGKMPIVAADGPGFLVNRLLLPYVTEAMELLLDGVDIHMVERVATEFGMAKGPLRLLDEIGLDTALQGGWVLSAAFPQRTVSSPLLVAMIKAKNLGTKTGSGFFDHKGEKEESLPIAAGVSELIEKWKHETPGKAEPPDDSVVLARLLLPMILEATRLLEDGTASRAGDIDLGVLFGLGFPADRGGLLYWADRLGAERIAEMLGQIEGLGARAQPTKMLLQMAAEGRTFYS